MINGGITKKKSSNKMELQMGRLTMALYKCIDIYFRYTLHNIPREPYFYIYTFSIFNSFFFCVRFLFLTGVKSVPPFCKRRPSSKLEAFEGNIIRYFDHTCRVQYIQCAPHPYPNVHNLFSCHCCDLCLFLVLTINNISNACCMWHRI